METGSRASGGEARPGDARSRRWLELTALAVLTAAICAWGVWPAWTHLNSDFPNYYTAAKIFRSGKSLDRAYEWTWFQREALRAGVVEQPIVGFVPQPPMTAVPVLPLTGLEPLAAKRAFTLFNLVLLVAAIVLIADVTGLSRMRAAILTAACTAPVAVNLRLGQYYLLILVLLLTAFREFKRERKITAGLLVAMAGSLKLFPFGFALLFLLRREWKALAGMVVGGIALAGVSVGLFGVEVHRVLLGEVLPRAARGELLAPYAISSFQGLWRHLFLFEPQLNPFPLYRSAFACATAIAASTVVALAIYALAVWRREIADEMAWAITGLWLSMMSALAVSYHYTVLIFPVALLAGLYAKQDRLKKAWVVAGIFVAICSLATNNTFLWLGTIALFAIAIADVGLEWPDRKVSLAAGLVLVAVFAGQVRSGMTVYAGREASYGQRVMNGQAGIRASQPEMAEGVSLVYAEMFREGNRAVFSSTAGARIVDGGGKILEVAAGQHSRFVYIEVEGEHPGIYRINAADPRSKPEWVVAGIEPAISPSGTWMAFVQDRGNAADLYRLRLDVPSVPEKVEGTGDALESAIDDAGDVVAALGRSSHARLASAKIPGVNSIEGPVRYPALSPDGRKIAYSRLEGEWWRLYVRELSSGHEAKVVDLPCNAIQPFWTTPGDLVYASDCGRGLELSAIATVHVPPE